MTTLVSTAIMALLDRLPYCLVHLLDGFRGTLVFETAGNVLKLGPRQPFNRFEQQPFRHVLNRKACSAHCG